MWTLRIKTFPLATEVFKLNLFFIKKLCGAETTTRTTAETRKFNKRDTAKINMKSPAVSPAIEVPQTK